MPFVTFGDTVTVQSNAFFTSEFLSKFFGFMGQNMFMWEATKMCKLSFL